MITSKTDDWETPRREHTSRAPVESDSNLNPDVLQCNAVGTALSKRPRRGDEKFSNWNPGMNQGSS